VWQHVLIVGLLMGFVCLGVGVWAEADGRPWQTMIFTTLALAQLGHAVAIRSDSVSLFTLGLRSNMYLTWTVLITLAIQILIIYWAPLQTLLHTEALSAGELVLVLLASTVVFWAVEIEKLVRRRLDRREPSLTGSEL
jgi:Ca2+-transporting ATPase